MSDDILISLKKETDILIHQTKTNPRELLEFEMNSSR